MIHVLTSFATLISV